MIYDVIVDGKSSRLELNLPSEPWLCRLDGREMEIDAALVRSGVLSLRIGNWAYEIKAERIADDLFLSVGTERFTTEIRDPRSLRSRQHQGEDRGPKKITAPMPGKVVRVLAREGEAIDTGRGIAVVEAMKMQNEIKSPKKGSVAKILVSEGTAVNAGDVLAIID